MQNTSTASCPPFLPIESLHLFYELCELVESERKQGLKRATALARRQNRFNRSGVTLETVNTAFDFFYNLNLGMPEKPNERPGEKEEQATAQQNSTNTENIDEDGRKIKKRKLSRHIRICENLNQTWQVPRWEKRGDYTDSRGESKNQSYGLTFEPPEWILNAIKEIGQRDISQVSGSLEWECGADIWII
ncbi:hypothetical protein BX616_010157 [Lobosporangium transversale]|nr:hypothetical protein BX616_010157 [Lobosporangium transversale]